MSDSDRTAGARSDDTQLTPGEVAVMVGIPSHSVRRWAQYHAEHLSDNANPGRNQQRRFTQHDVAVLKAAKPLHERGVSVALINERLRTIVIGEVVSEADSEPTEPLQPAPIAEASVAVQEGQGETSTMLPVLIEGLRSVTGPLEARLEALERRIEPVEAQRLRVDVAFLVLMAFVVGVLVGLAVWWFQ